MSETTMENMEVAISDVQPCRKKAVITVPAKDLESNASLIVKDFAAQATLPGFRTGKAPTALVRRRFADAIDAELLKNAQLALYDKLRETVETDLATLPLPEGKLEMPESGAPLKFTVSFDVAPKIDLPQYKGIKLQHAPAETAAKDIKAEIDKLRTEYAEMEKVDSPVKEQDMLEISISSDIECPEDAPESMKRLVNAEKTWCWLTSDYELLPGLLKALMGKKKKETIKLNMEFPEDYTEPLLAGSKGAYEITIIEIERRVPIKDDKALCEKLGVNNMDTLKERIKENLKHTAENEARTKNMSEAMDSLLDKSGDIPLPPSVLAQEIQQILRTMANEILKTQEDAEKFKDDIENHKKEAEKQAVDHLKKFFVAKKIVETENIQVSQQELDSSISGMSQTYGHDEKKLRQMLEKNGGMESLHIDMTIRKAMDFILDNAEIIEKKSKKKKEDSAEKTKSRKKTKTDDKTEKK